MSQLKTLSMNSLAPMAAAYQEPRFLADEMCLDWMKLSASVFIDPSKTLKAVWVKLHQSDFYVQRTGVPFERDSESFMANPLIQNKPDGNNDGANRGKLDSGSGQRLIVG